MFFLLLFSHKATEAQQIYIEDAQNYEIRLNSNNKYIFKFAKPTIYFWSNPLIDAYLLNGQSKLHLFNSYGGVSIKNFNNQALLIGSNVSTDDTAIIYFIPEKQLSKCQTFEAGIHEYSKSGVIPNTSYCGLFIPETVSDGNPILTFSGQLSYNSDFLFKFKPNLNSYAVYSGLFSASLYIDSPYHFFYFVTDSSNEERQIDISLTYPTNERINEFHSPNSFTNLKNQNYIIFKRTSSESSTTTSPAPSRKPRSRSHKPYRPSNKPITDQPIDYTRSPYTDSHSRLTRTYKVRSDNYNYNYYRPHKNLSEIDQIFYSLFNDVGDLLVVIIPFSLIGILAIIVYQYDRRRHRANNDQDIPPVQPLAEIDDSMPPIQQINNRSNNDIPIVYN